MLSTSKPLTPGRMIEEPLTAVGAGVFGGTGLGLLLSFSLSLSFPSMPRNAVKKSGEGDRLPFALPVGEGVLLTPRPNRFFTFGDEGARIGLRGGVLVRWLPHRLEPLLALRKMLPEAASPRPGRPNPRPPFGFGRRNQPSHTRRCLKARRRPARPTTTKKESCAGCCAADDTAPFDAGRSLSVDVLRKLSMTVMMVGRKDA